MSDVFLTVDRDGLTGGMQISISNDRHGYRIHGPKYCGQSAPIVNHKLNERDVQEITRYLAEVAQTPAPKAPS